MIISFPFVNLARDFVNCLCVVLEKVLEGCGDDIDSAIGSLNELRLS